MSPRNEFENYDGYIAPVEAEDLTIDQLPSEDELLLTRLEFEQDAAWSPTRDLQIKNLRRKITEDANREGEPEEG